MTRLNSIRCAAIAAIAVASFAPVAFAEPVVGLGVSFSFGQNRGLETGAGVRLLSGNKKGSSVATLGLDYTFKSRHLRPTIGAAHVGQNNYYGVDIGYDLADRGIDFGASVGIAKTK